MSPYVDAICRTIDHFVEERSPVLWVYCYVQWQEGAILRRERVNHRVSWHDRAAVLQCFEDVTELLRRRQVPNADELLATEFKTLVDWASAAAFEEK